MAAFAESEGFCRDCLAPVAARAMRCAACRGPRVIRHPELHQLSIAHLDCDAFYAAVEKRDEPSIRDKPVIIGGGRRGVVSTACYIARIQRRAIGDADVQGVEALSRRRRRLAQHGKIRPGRQRGKGIDARPHPMAKRCRLMKRFSTSAAPKGCTVEVRLVACKAPGHRECKSGSPSPSVSPTTNTSQRWRQTARSRAASR